MLDGKREEEEGDGDRWREGGVEGRVTSCDTFKLKGMERRGKRRRREDRRWMGVCIVGGGGGGGGGVRQRGE